ncbi:DNA cytosine methyltransferase [Paenibacillus barcinonensis]|uniref:DNA cytosine methyltransferase n=1 Tax=Paenibacillus barcinonensis TaxID=198119 RepID=UPI001C105A89|nr:DNA cytosine methyltransferase [Paenibacillus barcinonensis]MBU5356116.1 DNA cytosine methyltransferase [Paenibacillus barcinonensis]
MEALKDNVEYKTSAFLFAGVGGATAGAMRSQVEYGGKLYKFKVLCAIDSDPVACRNHDLITGEETAVCMDLFERWQYTAWHGHEPPEDWQEATAWDIWQAFKEQVPFFLFLSPPCKGLSGLLPAGKAASDKYQALNYLTVHGLELTLRACLEYGGSVPAVIQLENVPRITSRGKHLLSKIKKLLKKHGYAVSIRADHNLGEIGGLGQNRVRFLILARHEAQLPNVIYYPVKKSLRSIGSVLAELPEPGDIAAGGPLHKLPRLQWKTWMRLALIPAGGDWRDLNKVDWENLRVVHEPRRGAYEVADWDKPSRAVTSTAGPGRSNGVAAISDPRLQINGEGKTNLFRVQHTDEPASCVTGAAGPNQGAANISDPNLTKREGRHPGVYQIVPADEPAPCITGTRFGSGAIAVADPRVNTKLHPDSYGVQDWEATAKTVRSANRIMQAAGSVSDPRVPDRPGRYTDQFRVQSADGPAATVTGSTDVQNGAQLIADPNVLGQYHDGAYRVSDWEKTSPTVTTGGVSAGQGKVIADPRIKSAPRADTMGVLDWEQPSKTVIGSADVHAAAVAIADPRIPADNEQGVWTIISTDGTWHRPLTTFELAMIQSFPQYLPDGRPFQLEGCSDAKAREYIGNAVPPDAQEEMGNVLLLAAAEAEAGISFALSWDPVWVAPVADEIPAIIH